MKSKLTTDHGPCFFALNKMQVIGWCIVTVIRDPQSRISPVGEGWYVTAERGM